MLDLIRFITRDISIARGPIHPGEHLAVVLETMKTSPQELAQAIKVPMSHVVDILHGRRAVTADTALHLGRYVGTSATFWINLQQIYELCLVEHETEPRMKTILPANAPAT